MPNQTSWTGLGSRGLNLQNQDWEPALRQFYLDLNSSPFLGLELPCCATLGKLLSLNFAFLRFQMDLISSKWGSNVLSKVLLGPSTQDKPNKQQFLPWIPLSRATTPKLMRLSPTEYCYSPWKISCRVAATFSGCLAAVMGVLSAEANTYGDQQLH